MAETGMRLSPGMKVFLGVDVALVVTFLVLLVMAIAGGGSEDGASSSVDAPASAVGQVQAEPDVDQVAADPVSFTLPSGNIACEMSIEGVVCTIGSFTYAAPQVAGCEAPTGHVLQLDAEGVGFRCEQDGVPHIAAPTGPRRAPGPSSSTAASRRSAATPAPAPPTA